MALYFLIMIVTTSIALITVDKTNSKLLTLRIGNHTLYSRNFNYDISFLLIFGILAFFSAVRDGIGVDYNGYLHHITLIQEDAPQYMEIGFKTLVKLLQKIDGEPRIVMAVCGIATTWFYTKAIWKQSDMISDSVFIFLSWGYYFLTYNTVRNYLALSIILFAIRYLEQDKKLLFIAFVLFAATFHKSALICIPLYLICNMRWKKYYYAMLGMFTVGVFFLKGLISRMVFYFYPGYEGSAYDTGRISYLNILKAFLVIFLCFLSYKNVMEDKLNRLYFNLNLCSLMFYIGMYWVPEISRIGFYMNVTSILLIPRVLKKLDKTNSGIVARGIVYAASIILFFFLCKGFYGETMKLLPYKSWLF